MGKSRRQTAPQGGVADQKSETIGRYHQPSARECALLILRLMQAREQEVVGREVSRVRISQSTLRSLCGRSQITNDLLLEIQEFLLAAGWCLFCVGATHYALIRKRAVEGWGRISSGRIKDELTAVSHGQYDFEPLEPLLMPQESDTGDTPE
jgi:hypothetical protein